MLVESLYEGGTGSNSLSLVHPQTPPVKFEAGTENYLGIIGLGSSINFLEEIGIQKLQQKIFSLTRYCRKKLQESPEIKIYGDDTSISVVSFNLENVSPPELSYFLDREHRILTRAGILCTPLIHGYLNTFPEGVVRCSFGYTTTPEEIDLLCQSLQKYIQRGKSYAT
jgi:selenocysteine lyase/cysteine desulfurase